MAAGKMKDMCIRGNIRVHSSIQRKCETPGYSKKRTRKVSKKEIIELNEFQSYVFLFTTVG